MSAEVLGNNLGAAAAPHAIVLANALEKNGDAGVRWWAAEALGELGTAAAPHANVLTNAVEKDGDAGVRWKAAEALGNLGAAAAPHVGVLTNRLKKDGDAVVRNTAAEALGKLGAAAAPPYAQPILYVLIADVVKKRQQKSKDKQGKLGADENGSTRQAIANALISLFNSHDTIPPSAHAMLERAMLAIHTRENRTIIDALNNEEDKKILLMHTNNGMFHPVYAFAFHNMHVVVKRLFIANNELAQLQYAAGLTPAHFAAMGGATDTVNVLLKHGGEAICSSKDVNGSLPLHYAARYGHAETAKILVEAKATRSIADDAGLTALDLAEEGGFQELVDYLSAGAAPNATNPGQTGGDDNSGGADNACGTQLSVARRMQAGHVPEPELEGNLDVPRDQLHNSHPNFAVRYALVNVQDKTPDHAIMKMGVAFPAAVDFIRRLVDPCQVFKIGITDDPRRRARHGYPNNGYMVMYNRMDIIFRGTRDLAGALETHLISIFNLNGYSPSEKCGNDQPGDEGPRNYENIHYVYVVSR